MIYWLQYFNYKIDWTAAFCNCRKLFSTVTTSRHKNIEYCRNNNKRLFYWTWQRNLNPCDIPNPALTFRQITGVRCREECGTPKVLKTTWTFLSKRMNQDESRLWLINSMRSNYRIANHWVHRACLLIRLLRTQLTWRNYNAWVHNFNRTEYCSQASSSLWDVLHVIPRRHKRRKRIL